MLNTIITTTILFALAVNVNSFMMKKSLERRSINFGLNNNKSKNEVVETSQKKFKITDLIQLIAMGAGAPGLGEFDRCVSVVILFLKHILF